MNKNKLIKRLLIVAISFYLANLLLDVAQFFNLIFFSINYVRDILTITGSILLLICFVERAQGISIYVKIKSIFYSVVFIFGINYLFPFYVNQVNQRNTSLVISLSSLITIVFVVYILALIRELIIVQRKRGTGRNFNMLLFLFIYDSVDLFNFSKPKS